MRRRFFDYFNFYRIESLMIARFDGGRGVFDWVFTPS